MRPNSGIPLGLCQCGCGGKTRIAPYTKAARGYVKGQPIPYLLNHDKSRGRLDRYTVEDRGYDTPCWIWQGTIDKAKGYGAVKVNGKMLKVHRAMYEREVGPIPEGMTIDHLCKVRACLNPDHMEPVTDIENTKRGRHVKLSVADRLEIARLFPDVSACQLAARFRVNRTTIYRSLKEN